MQVSWIRHRDIHILTVGTYTYTTDQRFQTAFHRDFNEWTLQIKWAQKRDAGMYECQISTIPIKSFSVRLNVVGKWNNFLYFSFHMSFIYMHITFRWIFVCEHFLLFIVCILCIVDCYQFRCQFNLSICIVYKLCSYVISSTWKIISGNHLPLGLSKMYQLQYISRILIR